ncbi:hypothetical protein A3H12_04370 [Candidatus Uhrbacteria bacterium RIFCSPLOWO2_12_FULL_47_9]|nr:MAG: hypothetical protein A3H12_04370 [Candidatus Uhrbacteria bacterium RIFCSPLOWO2_12_FULL_47_9]
MSGDWMWIHTVNSTSRVLSGTSLLLEIWRRLWRKALPFNTVRRRAFRVRKCKLAESVMLRPGGQSCPSPKRAFSVPIGSQRVELVSRTEFIMSTTHTFVAKFLNRGVTIDPNTAKADKSEALRTAKRENLATIGKEVLNSTVALVEKGVDIEWLCPDGKAPAVDTLDKVMSLVEGGANVAELQKFSPSDILAGLNNNQLASLMPAPVVEIVEALVAEATETVVETKPEAPKVEDKVEAKPVEEWTCVITGETRPVEKMLVLKLALLDTKLDRRTTEADLRNYAVSAKGAMQRGLNRNDLMFLDRALDIVRPEEARAAASKQRVEEQKAARRKQDSDFRKTVFLGQPLKHPLTGETFVRCVQGRECEHALEKGTAFVGSVDDMQAPRLEDMQEMNYEAKRGPVDVSHLMTHYALCPKCAAKFIENPQSVAKAETEILGDLETNAAVYEASAEQDKLHAAFYTGPQAQKTQPRRFQQKGNRKG